jgi:hypothetical protein
MSGSLNEILQLIELLFYSYLKKKKETLVDWSPSLPNN